jgi:hypothetical protein
MRNRESFDLIGSDKLLADEAKTRNIFDFVQKQTGERGS